MLKNDIRLLPVLKKISGDFHGEHFASCILHEDSYDEDANEARVEDKFEWNLKMELSSRLVTRLNVTIWVKISIFLNFIRIKKLSCCGYQKKE